MSRYNYSRGETIKKASDSYSARLGGAGEEGAGEDDIKALLVHSLHPECFSDEQNSLANKITDPERQKALLRELRLNAGDASGPRPTGDFLWGAFVSLADAGRDKTAPDVQEGLTALLRRFEATGRVYRKYEGGPGGGKASGGFSDARNYVLLSGCLIKLYKLTGNLKLLNAALKLNDLLKHLMDEDAEPGPLAVIIYSLKEETKEVRKLYGSYELRLPSD